jgi:hypothetical protein
MPGRLTRDVDVQQSRSSENLEEVAQPVAPWIRYREDESRRPNVPYVEIAGPETDPYLPRFSRAESVAIAPNLRLNVPAPAEIAASKLAFADNIGRVQDLADLQFLRERFGLTGEQILAKVFSIAGETIRRYAVQNLQRLDRLIAEIPERRAQLIAHVREKALQAERARSDPSAGCD